MANDGRWYPPAQYGGGYPPMPAVAWRPVEPGPAPPAVLYAVWLMVARVALGIVRIAVGLALRNTLRSDVMKRDPTLGPAEVNAAVTIAIILIVAYGLAFLVLYVLLALQLKKGKRWAHIVTLVLVSVGLFFGLLTFFRNAPAISQVLLAIIAVVDVGIIVLLARKESVRFFNSNP